MKTLTLFNKILFGLMLTLVIWILYQKTGLPVHDQGAILSFQFKNDGFPAFFHGIGIYLITGVYHFFTHPPLETANLEIKIIAAICFSVSSFLFASQILKRQLLVTSFIILLFTSKYLFLWLSTELFAASFFILFLYLLNKKQWPLMTGIVLAYFGLIKVEIILPSLALLVLTLYSVRNRPYRLKLINGYAIIFFGFHLTGLLLMGKTYFTEYSNRSLDQLCIHFGELFFKQQFNPDFPNPWLNFEAWHNRFFPGCKNVLDVIIKHPSLYMDFFAMSVMRTLKRALYLYNFLLLIFPIRYYLWRKTKASVHFIEPFVWVSLIGLMPIISTSFIHVRYFARYYVPVLLILLLTIDKIIDMPVKNAWQKNILNFSILSLIAGMGLGFFQFFVEFRTENFWFPD